MNGPNGMSLRTQISQLQRSVSALWASRARRSAFGARKGHVVKSANVPVRLAVTQWEEEFWGKEIAHVGYEGTSISPCRYSRAWPEIRTRPSRSSQ
jgi:hypothetical protein